MNVEPSLIVAALAGAATLGAGLYRLGSLEARVRSLEAFKARAGERLGRVEDATRHLRKLTGAQGIPQIGGGQVAEPVDDASDER